MRPKLLLADDSVTIQRVIELTFADENVEVVAVGDGKEAIDRLQSDPPDIVLADVGMPERNGYEVAEFIKGDPRFTHIPVLLLTGAFEPVDDGRARSIGCEGVLVKPFEPQMVISRVRELLAAPRAKTAEPVAAAEAAPSPAPPEVGAAAAPPAPEPQAAEASPEALEDYFDRLDAALANLGASPAAPPALESVMTGASGARPAGAVHIDAAPAGDFQPDIPAGRVPPLHAAFAALLAAERGEPVAVPLPAPEPLSEETMEEIVKRVAARMGDEKMRTLVLDVAERLVREEIDRIKLNAEC